MELRINSGIQFLQSQGIEITKDSSSNCVQNRKINKMTLETFLRMKLVIHSLNRSQKICAC